MSITIKEELHPVFETLALTFNYCNRERLKPLMIKAFNEMGYDGERLVQEKLEFQDTYLDAFGGRFCPHQDDDLFFGDVENNFFIYPTLILMEYPQCINSLDELSPTTLRHYLGEILKGEEIDRPPSGKDPISQWIKFIEGLHCSYEIKWRLLLLLEDPRRYLGSLIQIYQDNLPAYQDAVARVQPLLDKKIPAMVANGSPLFQDVVEKFAPNAVVYPSLAAPLSEFIGYTICIHGLFLDELPDWSSSGEKAKENLLMVLKAISDKSKFEILTSLKAAPKYNLEIAEALGLTPATVSHHMNMLLNCGLVKVDKKEGKVYYSQATQEIEQAIKYLNRYLLDK